jgi:DnaJ-class molecular chaperone
VQSAWKTRHDLAEDACPECQGSTYVPSRTSEERMVEECPKCSGTGTNATKKAA